MFTFHLQSHTSQHSTHPTQHMALQPLHPLHPSISLFRVLAKRLREQEDICPLYLSPLSLSSPPLLSPPLPFLPVPSISPHPSPLLLSPPLSFLSVPSISHLPSPPHVSRISIPLLSSSPLPSPSQLLYIWWRECPCVLPVTTWDGSCSSISPSWLVYNNFYTLKPYIIYII